MSIISNLVPAIKAGLVPRVFSRFHSLILSVAGSCLSSAAAAPGLPCCPEKRTSAAGKGSRTAERTHFECWDSCLHSIIYFRQIQIILFYEIFDPVSSQASALSNFKPVSSRERQHSSAYIGTAFKGIPRAAGHKTEQTQRDSGLRPPFGYSRPPEPRSYGLFSRSPPSIRAFRFLQCSSPQASQDGGSSPTKGVGSIP